MAILGYRPHGISYSKPNRMGAHMTVLNMRGEPVPASAPSKICRSLLDKIMLITHDAQNNKPVHIKGEIRAVLHTSPPKYEVKTDLGIFEDVIEENIYDA